MEAVQRDVLSNNWIVLIFIFSIGILFFLKIFNTDKLKGYATSIFNKGFIEIEAEENYFRFSFFHVGFSFFFLVDVNCFYLFNDASKLPKRGFFVFRLFGSF